MPLDIFGTVFALFNQSIETWRLIVFVFKKDVLKKLHLKSKHGKIMENYH